MNKINNVNLDLSNSFDSYQLTEMDSNISNKVLINLICLALIDALVIKNNNINKINTISEEIKSDNDNIDNSDSDNSTDVFNGVYTECFVQLSYTCLQKKTLLYLKELNRLNEISVIGDYVKFGKYETFFADLPENFIIMLSKIVL